MLNVVTIKALTKLLPSDMQEDHSLCPVKALRYYQRHSKKDIHVTKRFIYESWLKLTILVAYGEEGKPTVVKTQVRCLAASWALHANAPMSACSRKSHNTFSQFYLKDLALICDQM